MSAIIIIDPHPLLRMGLIQLLTSSFSDITITALDYEHLYEVCTEPNPCNLLLLTLDSHEKSTTYFQLIERNYAPKAILLLIEPQQFNPNLYRQHPLVRGIVSKAASLDLVQASVQLVLAGGTCFPNHPTQFTQPTPLFLYSDEQQTSASTEQTNQIVHDETLLLGLTVRQYEVLVLLAQGLPLKSIAKQLDISVATAKSHTETLYQRLDVNNRNAAVYTAISRGATLGWVNTTLT